jgi:hypothetical protein
MAVCFWTFLLAFQKSILAMLLFSKSPLRSFLVQPALIRRSICSRARTTGLMGRVGIIAKTALNHDNTSIIVGNYVNREL